VSEREKQRKTDRERGRERERERELSSADYSQLAGTAKPDVSAALAGHACQRRIKAINVPRERTAAARCQLRRVGFKLFACGAAGTDERGKIYHGCRPMQRSQANPP
jgi:hypothetical protein